MCSRTLYALPLVMIGILSCDSPSEPPGDPQISVAPQSQWAGGMVSVDITGLDPTDVVSVLAGSNPLVFEIADPSTLSARLPASANGTEQIWIQTPSRRLPAGVVEVFGFVESKIVTPMLVRGLRDWKSGPGAAVVGPTGSGIGIVFPAGGPGVVFDGIHQADLLYSPGQSADPLDLYTRNSSIDSITQWRLTTAVPPTELNAFPVSASWSIARLQPDLWLLAYHHFLQTVRVPANNGSIQTLLDIRAEGTLDWEWLPSVGHVAAAGSFGEGLPVFNTGDGMIAYRISNVATGHGLTAVPSTSEFVVASRDIEPVGRYSLTVVDGLTGAIKQTREIEPWPVNTEVDTARGTIYVLHLSVLGEGFLGIYNKATLDLVGKIEVPKFRAWDVELVQDEDHIYAVLGSSDPQGTVVHTLRLLPETVP